MIKICGGCGMLIGKIGKFSFVSTSGGCYHKNCVPKLGDK